MRKRKYPRRWLVVWWLAEVKRTYWWSRKYYWVKATTATIAQRKIEEKYGPQHILMLWPSVKKPKWWARWI